MIFQRCLNIEERASPLNNVPENPNDSLLTSQEAGLTSKPPEKDIVLNSPAFSRLDIICPTVCTYIKLNALTLYSLVRSVMGNKETEGYRDENKQQMNAATRTCHD